MAASLSTLAVAADNNGCFPFSPSSSSSSTTTSRTTTTTTCLCYSSSKPLLSFRCSTSPAPLRANPPPILPRTFLLSPFQPLLRRATVNCNLPEKFRGAALHVAAASAAAVAELDEEEDVKEAAAAASSQTVTTPKKGKAALPLKRDRSRSKRFLEIQKLRENKKEYDLPTAVFLLKQTANTKFLETVEAHFRLNIDPKYNDQQLRATVIFPKGTGQTVRIAVLAQGDKIEEAKNAGADIFGGDDLIQQIKDGFLEFDKLIATPDMMAKVASLGKLLGPRGLMPNPKAGTVTNDLPQTIAEFKKGKIEYRVDKTGIVHVPFGKANFSQEDLIINLVAAIKSVEANKPSGARGVYWRSVHICSSMGPSIRLNVKEMLDYKPTFTQ